MQRFSPEHQPRIALRGAPAAARTAEVERQSLEQQYGACRKERSQCQTRLSELEKGQQALGKRALAGEALTTDLSACRTNLLTLQNCRTTSRTYAMPTNRPGSSRERKRSPRSRMAQEARGWGSLRSRRLLRAFSSAGPARAGAW